MFIFFAKLIDSLIVSFSQILTYKNKKYLASIFTALNIAIFFSIISKFMEVNNTQSLIIISVAGALGKYLSMVLDDKLTKDSVWLVLVTYKGDKMELQYAIDELRLQDVDVYSYSTNYDNKGGNSLSLKIMSKDRQTTKLIRELMPDKTSISVVQLKEYY